MNGTKAAAARRVAGARRESSSQPSGNLQSRAADFSVLVVDDDHVVRDAVAAMLKTRGYRISKAGDGIAAMSRLATGRYDLVITDMEMPPLNGYRLCVRIKRESPDTRVIIMTGQCRDEIARFTRTGLVDAWIFKPFGIEELYGTLSRLLAS